MLDIRCNRSTSLPAERHFPESHYPDVSGRAATPLPRRRPVHCGMLGSVLGLHPLDAGSTLYSPLPVCDKVSPRIAECPQGAKLLTVEKHCHWAIQLKVPAWLLFQSFPGLPSMLHSHRKSTVTEHPRECLAPLAPARWLCMPAQRMLRLTPDSLMLVGLILAF